MPKGTSTRPHVPRTWNFCDRIHVQAFGREIIGSLQGLPQEQLEWLQSAIESARSSVYTDLNSNPAVSHDIGRGVTSVVASMLFGQVQGIGGGGFGENTWDGAGPSNEGNSWISDFLQEVLEDAAAAHGDDSWGYSIYEFLQDLSNLFDFLSQNAVAGVLAPLILEALGALAAYVDFTILGGAILNALAFGNGALANLISGIALAYATTMVVAVLIVVIVIILLVVLVSEIVCHWDEITAWFEQAFQDIGEWFSTAWDDICGFAADAWDWLCGAVGDAWDFFSSLFKGNGIITVDKPPPASARRTRLPHWWEWGNGDWGDYPGGLLFESGLDNTGFDWSTLELQIRNRCFESMQLRYNL